MVQCYKCGGNHAAAGCKTKVKRPTYTTEASSKAAQQQAAQNEAARQRAGEKPTSNQTQDNKRKAFVIVGAFFAFAAVVFGLSKCTSEPPPAPQPDLSEKYPSIAVAFASTNGQTWVAEDPSDRTAKNVAVNNCWSFQGRYKGADCSILSQTKAGAPRCITYTTIPLTNKYDELVDVARKSFKTYSAPERAQAEELCKNYKEQAEYMKMCLGRIVTHCNYN